MVKCKTHKKKGCYNQLHCCNQYQCTPTPPHIYSYDTLLSQYSQYILRTYDGSANNLFTPTSGKAGELLVRVASADYDSGEVSIRGSTNPNPRVVSNSICQGTSVPNTLKLTDMMWVWGQFLDHELDITPNQEGSVAETLNMTTPVDDIYPGYTIPFTRSQFNKIDGTRQQPSNISAFIDASNVYGYGTDRAYALRRLDGTGKLKNTTGDTGEILLPYNTEGLSNAAPPGSTSSDFFLAGDIRSNEIALLTGMHTVFMREHNRLCDEIIKNNSQLTGQDEMIYQRARRWVGAFMQVITYKEFLPAFLGGAGTLGSYTQYDPTINANISNEFSTVGYRLGHTMVSSEVQLGTDPANTVLVRNLFFTPSYIKTNGVDNMLYGVTQRPMQEIDGILVEDLRSFLFAAPASGILHDLAALNLQRGRDHGIPGYNTLRGAYGLSQFTNISEIPTSVDTKTKLTALYDSPDAIDPWIGAIIEDHLPGEAVGPLVHEILVEQFARLRKGDRFFFENDAAFTETDRSNIRNTKLSDILNRNTSFNYAADVFHLN